jgi:hypothetical protein
MNQFSNPIENSLLQDILHLYACDLERDAHTGGHFECLACSRLAIIDAINQHNNLIGLLVKKFLASNI